MAPFYSEKVLYELVSALGGGESAGVQTQIVPHIFRHDGCLLLGLQLIAVTALKIPLPTNFQRTVDLYHAKRMILVNFQHAFIMGREALVFYQHAVNDHGLSGFRKQPCGTVHQKYRLCQRFVIAGRAVLNIIYDMIFKNVVR